MKRLHFESREDVLVACLWLLIKGSAGVSNLNRYVVRFWLFVTVEVVDVASLVEVAGIAIVWFVVDMSKLNSYRCSGSVLVGSAGRNAMQARRESGAYIDCSSPGSNIRNFPHCFQSSGSGDSPDTREDSDGRADDAPRHRRTRGFAATVVRRRRRRRRRRVVGGCGRAAGSWEERRGSWRDRGTEAHMYCPLFFCSRDHPPCQAKCSWVKAVGVMQG